jgi:hypothetical protein
MNGNPNKNPSDKFNEILRKAQEKTEKTEKNRGKAKEIANKFNQRSPLLAEVNNFKDPRVQNLLANLYVKLKKTNSLENQILKDSIIDHATHAVASFQEELDQKEQQKIVDFLDRIDKEFNFKDKQNLETDINILTSIFTDFFDKHKDHLTEQQKHILLITQEQVIGKVTKIGRSIDEHIIARLQDEFLNSLNDRSQSMYEKEVNDFFAEIRVHSCAPIEIPKEGLDFSNLPELPVVEHSEVDIFGEKYIENKLGYNQELLNKTRLKAQSFIELFDLVFRDQDGKPLNYLEDFYIFQSKLPFTDYLIAEGVSQKNQFVIQNLYQSIAGESKSYSSGVQKLVESLLVEMQNEKKQLKFKINDIRTRNLFAENIDLLKKLIEDFNNNDATSEAKNLDRMRTIQRIASIFDYTLDKTI